MNDLTQFGPYTIATSVEREDGHTFGVAYCPLCPWKEESDDHGLGDQHGVNVSLGKIRTHIRMAHKVEEGKGDSSNAGGN